MGTRIQDMKKKGSLDNLWIAVSFFGFALVMLVVMIFWNNVTTTEMDTELWDRTDVGTNIKVKAQRAVDNFDNISILAYIGIHLGAIVLAFMLRTHPIIFVVVFVMSLALVIVSPILSNTWQDIVEQEADFTTAISSYPKLNYIMYNFPKFELIWLLATGVCLAGFSRMEEGGF